MPSDERHIFISYARENHEFCHQLVKKLKEKNFDVWMDTESIPPGSVWEKDIVKAIQSATDVIAVHSSTSLGRSYQAKGEWLHAQDLGKRIFPIIIEAGVNVHRTLQHLNAVDFSRPGTFDEHLQKLMDTLNSTEAGVEINSPYVIDYSGGLARYPNFSDGFANNYSDFINHAIDICCMAGVGHRFLTQHGAVLRRRLTAGSKLRLILAKPTECNINVIASWSSAEPPALNYERLQHQVRETARELDSMQKFVPSESIELCLLPDVPSFTTFQFDPQKPEGIIVFNAYPLGPATQMGFRLSTIIERRIFADLYDHFCISFDNAWNRAERISVADYINQQLSH